MRSFFSSFFTCLSCCHSLYYEKGGNFQNGVNPDKVPINGNGDFVVSELVLVNPKGFRDNLNLITDRSRAEPKTQNTPQDFNSDGIGLGPINYSNTIEAKTGLESKQFNMDATQLRQIEREALRLSKARDAETRDAGAKVKKEAENAKSGEITSTTQSTSLVFKHQDSLSDNSREVKSLKTPSSVIVYPIKANTVLEMVSKIENLNRDPQTQVVKTEAVR